MTPASAAGHPQPAHGHRRPDLSRDPMLVFYEITRACDLACAHCRACAQPHRHPYELTPHQSLALVDELIGFDQPPMLVLTGGDPLKRPDVADVVAHAAQLGLHVAMTPSATPLVTAKALQELHDAGLQSLAVSLDSSEPATHDAIRMVPGSYERTLEILATAREIGLNLQINTTITRRNAHQVDELAEQLNDLGIMRWAVFFLVPVGRGLQEQRIRPEEYETVFERLWHHAQHQPYAIKTTEAHHYRRYVLQQVAHEPASSPARRLAGRLTLGINDGKGVMFVSHTGQVFPSGFMPIECGRFPAESPVDVYRHSPMMRSLRQPEGFHGKCAICEYRGVCGGSRARAYAVTRDALASEPDCLYQPQVRVAS